MKTSHLLALCAALAFGSGCTEAADSPGCEVKITDTNINGDAMTADGTFITAQPILVLQKGSTHQQIAGIDDGHGHATFDLTGLAAGRWEYSFEASCYDEEDSPHVDAPTGFFTRS